MIMMMPLLWHAGAVELLHTASASPPSPLDKATEALDSLWSTFWDERSSYLLRDAPDAYFGDSRGGGGAPLLGYWNYQEATHAMALGASLDYKKNGPKLKAMIAGQAAMNSQRQPGTGTGPGPAGTDGWTRPYFDDMNWAELALLAANDAAVIAGDKEFAESLLIGATNTSIRNIFGGVATGRARRPFPQTISSAWDTTDCGGGVYWDRNKTQKATASNAGVAITCALFSSALNATPATDPEANWRMAMSAEYTKWSQMVYNFWNRTMTSAETGQVIDHYNVGDGGVCSKSSLSESFTYNEGLMLGAATALRYPADAARFATRLASAHVTPSAQGGVPVLSDGCEASCTSFDCPSFKGVAVRELGRWLKSPLASAQPKVKAVVKKLVTDSALAVWENARAEGTTGPLFSAVWSKPTTAACKYNAAAHTSAVFALLSQVDIIEPSI